MTDDDNSSDVLLISLVCAVTVESNSGIDRCDKFGQD